MFLWVHLSFALVADALLIIAALLSSIYLVQDYLLKSKRTKYIWSYFPSINLLDELCLKLLIISFACMTIGIIAGSKLAMDYWGPRWYLDVRQIWSMAIWLLFAAVLLARFTVGWRGPRAQWVTLIGVCFMILGLFFLNYLGWTKHLNMQGLT